MADVWAVNVEKARPVFNPRTGSLTVPVVVQVTLDIDGAGPVERGSTTVSRQVEPTRDVETLAAEMAEEIQTYIDALKRGRNAEKHAKYTALISAIEQAIDI